MELIKTTYFLQSLLRRYYNPSDIPVRALYRISNLVLPLWFKLNFNYSRNSIRDHSSDNDVNPPLIVSLTSFPSRINKVWLTIESILRQSQKPDKILIWLSKTEFPDKATLPSNLLSLENRGVEIRFCEDNLKPHKKYYYSMREYPDANVITIDDDMLYPPDLIKNLLESHNKYPKSIISTVTRRINSDYRHLKPYNDWDYQELNTGPLYSNLMVGVGGVLYPPNSLHSDIFDKKRLIEIALNTDDLWLKIMSIRNGTKVASIAGKYQFLFIPIRFKTTTKLMEENIGNGQNDVVFKKLINHYNLTLSDFIDYSL